MFDYKYMTCKEQGDTFILTLRKVYAHGGHDLLEKTVTITKPGFRPGQHDALNTLVAHETAVNTALGPPDCQLRVAGFVDNASQPLDDPTRVRDWLLEQAATCPVVTDEDSYTTWIEWTGAWAPLPPRGELAVPLYVFPSRLWIVGQQAYQYPWALALGLARWRTGWLYPTTATHHERAALFFAHIATPECATIRPFLPEGLPPAAYQRALATPPPSADAPAQWVPATHHELPKAVYLADPAHHHTDLIAWASRNHVTFAPEDTPDAGWLVASTRDPNTIPSTVAHILVYPPPPAPPAWQAHDDSTTLDLVDQILTQQTLDTLIALATQPTIQPDSQAAGQAHTPATVTPWLRTSPRTYREIEAHSLTNCPKALTVLTAPSKPATPTPRKPTPRTNRPNPLWSLIGVTVVALTLIAFVHWRVSTVPDLFLRHMIMYHARLAAVIVVIMALVKGTTIWIVTEPVERKRPNTPIPDTRPADEERHKLFPSSRFNTVLTSPPPDPQTALRVPAPAKTAPSWEPYRALTTEDTRQLQHELDDTPSP